MRVLRIAVLAAAVMVFFFSANAQAVMVRVILNAFTTNFPDPAQKQMNLHIQVFDTIYGHPPAFVQTISVNAPDGSVFSVDPKKDWLPYSRVYWKGLYASDFVSDTIPGGTYYVTVTPVSGSAIKELDSLDASFLPVSTVTSPADGAIGVGATPTFTWTGVSGASYYQVMLWNKTLNEPVYWFWDWHSEKVLHTDFARVTMPPGVLKPNSQYQLRIEARSGSQDLDKRSRSAWVNFTTGSW